VWSFSSRSVYIFWTDHLEFETDVKVGDVDISLNTSDESITLLFTEGEKNPPKQQTYSVAKVHDRLAKTLPDTRENGHNKVVAGITLFSKIGDNIIGYFEVFKEIKEEKNNLVFKKGKHNLVFQSGYPDLEKKIESGTITYGSPDYTVTNVIKCLESFKEEDETPQLKKAREYWKFWREKQEEALKKLQVEVLNNNETLITPGEFLVKVQEVYKKQKPDFSERIGSLIDSEQYFLIWLSKKLGQSGEPCPLLASTEFFFLKTYQSFLSNEFLKLLKGESYWKGMSSGKTLSSYQEDFSEKKYLGALIHLHSDLEMCLSCAVSLALTFLSGKDAGVANLKEKLAQLNKDDVSEGIFVYCTVSCNKLILDNNGLEGISCDCYKPSDKPHRPLGIGKEMEYECTSGSSWPLGGLIEHKILMQLRPPLPAVPS
jgi:hypothetical protein